jgi:putative ABC transport system ATP-binding protein
MPRVELREVTREYRHGMQPIRALDRVSLSIEGGEFVSVVGPSGAGKSTLLHLVGGLDAPTSGTVLIEGQDLAVLSDKALATFRRTKLGFVFQFFNLLPTLCAWENVALPRLLDGTRLAHVRDHAVELLERVGLGQRVDHRPAELSGGEMQRVAVARALVMDPVLILADEPTGNLDSKSGEEVLDLLVRCTREDGRTVVVVTHNLAVAAKGDRIVRLADGRVVADEPTSAEAVETPLGASTLDSPGPRRT